MKKTLFLLCLLFATAAFAQHAGPGISSQPQIYTFPDDHPGHASYASMAHEQSILPTMSYASAQGEKPASDFPHQATAEETVSLGTVARELRQQHAQVKKARVVWVNQ